jgi:AraC-like DNA-binding protein
VAKLIENPPPGAPVPPILRPQNGYLFLDKAKFAASFAGLHGTIHTEDLSAVARRSPAHFARSFKHSFGESPHAYVMRRRLENACHLMMTSSESLSQIALSVGFSDQSHLCKRFKEALGQSPSNWRRERELSDSPSSHEPARTEGYGHGSRERNGSKVPPVRLVDRQQTREKMHENRSSPQLVSSSAD